MSGSDSSQAQPAQAQVPHQMMYAPPYMNYYMPPQYPGYPPMQYGKLAELFVCRKIPCS